ncbi:MAG: gamma-glutamyltransferase, partial [Aldersonia sp.]|nr:gamma-glutamyltransferase [Aldersonia sp.]
MTLPARPSALSAGGMVSSSHPAASAAGARVLAAGGNAIDATLAMAAITWLTLPGQCGIGGDAFAVVREPDGRVWTVGQSGYGPDGGT